IPNKNAAPLSLAWSPDGNEQLILAGDDVTNPVATYRRTGGPATNVVAAYDRNGRQIEAGLPDEPGALRFRDAIAWTKDGIYVASHDPNQTPRETSIDVAVAGLFPALNKVETIHEWPINGMQVVDGRVFVTSPADGSSNAPQVYLLNDDQGRGILGLAN